MTRAARSIVAVLSFIFPTVGSAADCAGLPVITAEQAICRARKFAEKPKPPPWALEFKATEEASHWIVYYGPKSSEVLGGAADLRIDKKTGAVTFLRGYK